ncbi:MAG: cyclic pyranopterin monophosphate synthase MoaC [Desulfurococcales archaeon]|nr:cyclic pyranopterin monophosphate synthase MoaC [Desulfurococcales archaeon]
MGSPGMVDVSGKPVIPRRAIARGRIRLRPETVRLIREGRVEKGDVLSVASVAAVMAVKDTPRIVPLCHPIPIHGVRTGFELGPDYVEVTVEVVTKAETGVEMEALTGAAAALLAVWDMVKKYEKDEEGQYPVTRIEFIRVERKEKGV